MARKTKKKNSAGIYGWRVMWSKYDKPSPVSHLILMDESGVISVACGRRLFDGQFLARPQDREPCCKNCLRNRAWKDTEKEKRANEHLQ